MVPPSEFLRVGECVLETSRREIRCPRRPEPMRITVKSQQVLMVLVAHRDKVVSREALIEWVWPDTLPTDDVLTQAIAQLRKAFCDDRGAPRYLETIAKSGYRLLADIRWSDTAELPAEPTLHARPERAEPASRIFRAKPAALLLLLAAAGVFAWIARPPTSPDASAASSNLADTPPQAAVAADYQRITSLPGDEAWPSLSPDGGQVAYSEYMPDGSARLLVQATAPVPARALTPPSKGRVDVMAVWSPDGRQLAFTRYEHGTCALLLMPSSGGPTRTVGKCRVDMLPSYSWDPQARHLVAVGMGDTLREAGSFRVLDLATGGWQPLAYSKGEHDVDSWPTYSPDGKWIAFQRNVSPADLWRVPANGGTPQRLTHLRTSLFGLGWLPDSRSIVFSGRRDDRVALLRLDLEGGRIETVGAWEADALYPSVAGKAPSTTFMLSKAHSRLFSVPLPGAAGEGRRAGQERDAAPDPVFPSTGNDMMPAISPDGRQIAFVSDRSGHAGVWWAELGQPESLRWIEGIVPTRRQPPVWSADSQRLLVVGRGRDGDGVHEITPALSQLRRLPTPAAMPVRAEYLPDRSRVLVVADKGRGQLALLLYDRSTRPWRVLASLDDVAFVRADPARHRVLFTRDSRPGVWQAGLDLASPRQLSSESLTGATGGRRIVIAPGGAWLARSDETCGLRWIALDLPGQRSRCLQPQGAQVTGAGYDPLRRRLHFSSEERENSDIGWIALAGSTAG